MRLLVRPLDVVELWMTGQGLAGSEVVGSLKPESPFLPVLHHYHYSGQSCYLECRETK